MGRFRVTLGATRDIGFRDFDFKCGRSRQIDELSGLAKRVIFCDAWNWISCLVGFWRIDVFGWSERRGL